MLVVYAAAAAVSASPSPVHHHRLADLHAFNPFAEGSHPARVLMAECHRTRHHLIKMHDVKVGMAKPRTCYLDEHFARPGARHWHLLNARLMRCDQTKRLHRVGNAASNAAHS